MCCIAPIQKGVLFKVMALQQAIAGLVQERAHDVVKTR